MDLNDWARTIADHLTHHMDTERDVLTRYGEMAADTPDERLRYLIELILDDEVRHHRLFAEMVNWLRSETEHRTIDGPRMPSNVAPPDPAVQADLLARTDELLGFEREDLRELKDLRRELGRVEDTAWWTSLLDTMEHDTRKHIGLLEFIQKELER